MIFLMDILRLEIELNSSRSNIRSVLMKPMLTKKIKWYQSNILFFIMQDACNFFAWINRSRILKISQSALLDSYSSSF